MTRYKLKTTGHIVTLKNNKLTLTIGSERQIKTAKSFTDTRLEKSKCRTATIS